MTSRRTIGDIIAATEYPRTRDSLSADMRALGVNTGDIVVPTHSNQNSDPAD